MLLSWIKSVQHNIVIFMKEKGGGAVGMTLDLYNKKKDVSSVDIYIYYTLKVNPFTALACNISRLNDAQTCLQTVVM